MNLFKKLIPSGQKTEVTTIKHWVVKWHSRYGEFRGDTTEEAEFFINEEEAIQFRDQLKEAFKLIRHTSGAQVKISQGNP